MTDSRTYIRVHDGFLDHPKIQGLSDRAIRLLLEMWTWCSRYLTDGSMPLNLWDRRGTAKARRELVTAGLISVANDRVLVHDYLEHQRSAEQVAEIRTAKKRASSLGNHNRWHKSRGITDPGCVHCSRPAAEPSHNVSQVGSQVGSFWDPKTYPKRSPVSVTDTETKTKTLADLDGGVGNVGRRADDNDPPPPLPLDPYRCPRHQAVDGDPGPCRPCRDARHRQEELAHLAQSRAFQADRKARDQQIRDRLAAVAACDLCDETGYRGRVVCDHVDRPARHIAIVPTATTPTGAVS